ncbi:SRPBCC domain-containing protein [Acaryochloris sp. IP29b_bin.137]|uniref:SRPBCC domain-containing protein n=1 Tax=Acaryochloris sp. IP29b_bin.137 TaxID=2969217 RepID=UPI00262ADBC2|nr:SRPBCC domain-containing protein [Acaryochloris sp. IP29b_bin.137]
MRQYHTEIVVDAPVDRVWNVLTDFSAYPTWNPLVGWLQGDIYASGQIQMWINPLNRSFNATLTRVQENEALIWVGVQGASWLLSGEHYYQLEELGEASTRLLHGEYFRGLGSWFIRNATLQTMEQAFIQHNRLLKERIEDV